MSIASTKNPMADVFPQRDRRAGPWFSVLPLVLLLAVLALELATPAVRVTPSLLTIGLAALSLLLPPRQIAIWALLLFLPVVASFLLVANAGVPEQMTVILLRSAAFLVVALMAFSLSRYRERSEQQFNSLVTMFDTLVTPIVVSDGDGNICFANRTCCELLGCSQQEAKDSTFFSLFSHPERQGKAIEQYLQHFDRRPSGRIEMTLSVRGRCQSMKSICSMLEIDGRKLLVSQLI